MSASEEADKPGNLDESVAEKRGRGRPEFVPTKFQRQQVEVMAGSGSREGDIADALRISPPTLRKYFEEELRFGRAKRRGAMIMAQYKAGIKGNVSAQKAYLALGDAVYRVPEAQTTAAPLKEKPLGKKALASLAAETAGEGTDWGEDLLPQSEQRH